MIIKKFQGKTKEEALESARKELGDNIVEMNTKNVKSKRAARYFQGNESGSNSSQGGRQR